MPFWSKKKNVEPAKPKQFSNLPLTADQLPEPPPSAAQPPNPADAVAAVMRGAERQAARSATPDQAAAPEITTAQRTPEQQRAIAGMREQAQRIASFLKTQPQFQSAPDRQVETLVGLAVPLGQWLLAESENKEIGQSLPIGAVLWAMVSPGVDERLTASANSDQPLQLAAEDWKSGDIPWVIVIAGEQSVMQAMLQRLTTKEFKGRSIKMRMKDKEGKTRVAIVNPAKGQTST